MVNTVVYVVRFGFRRSKSILSLYSMFEELIIWKNLIKSKCDTIMPCFSLHVFNEQIFQIFLSV